MPPGTMTLLRFGGAAFAVTLGLGLAAACSSDDGQRVNGRDDESPGGAGAGNGAEAGAGGSSNVSGSTSVGGEPTTNGGAGGEPTTNGGAGGEPTTSGGAAGAELGGAAGEGGAGGSGEQPIDLGLLGCVQVAGERPASSNNAQAPLVADLQLDPTNPGEELSGSFSFKDTDPKELLVQVGGSNVHYVCPLSTADLAAKVAQLDPLSLNPAFPEGSRLVYFGVRDDAGNVSSYLIGGLAVGQGTDPGVDLCEEQSSVQLMGSLPSTSTIFYEQTNGYSPDYRLGGGNGGNLVVVGSTRLHVNLGQCTALRLAGDATGTKPLGWDNCLVVEYRPSVGAPVANAWSFCGDYGDVFSVAKNAALPIPLRPSLPGSALEPSNGSPLAFGYPALAIDLAALIPNGDKDFELSLHVLDFGDIGSTTNIWAISSKAP